MSSCNEWVTSASISMRAIYSTRKLFPRFHTISFSCLVHIFQLQRIIFIVKCTFFLFHLCCQTGKITSPSRGSPSHDEQIDLNPFEYLFKFLITHTSLIPNIRWRVDYIHHRWQTLPQEPRLGFPVIAKAPSRALRPRGRRSRVSKNIPNWITSTLLCSLRGSKWDLATIAGKGLCESSWWLWGTARWMEWVSSHCHYIWKLEI